MTTNIFALPAMYDRLTARRQELRKWVWSSLLRGSRKVVLLALVEMTDMQGMVWPRPNLETLAQLTGLSVRQVQRCLNDFVRMGLLIKERDTVDYQENILRVMIGFNLKSKTIQDWRAETIRIWQERRKAGQDEVLRARRPKPVNYRTRYLDELAKGEGLQAHPSYDNLSGGGSRQKQENGISRLENHATFSNSELTAPVVGVVATCQEGGPDRNLASPLPPPTTPPYPQLPPLRESILEINQLNNISLNTLQANQNTLNTQNVDTDTAEKAVQSSVLDLIRETPSGGEVKGGVGVVGEGGENNAPPAANPESVVRGESGEVAEKAPRPPRRHKSRAAQIFRNLTHRWPNAVQEQEIDKVVGADEVNLRKWEEVVRRWGLRGYNPTNVQGMLDWFCNGIPQPNIRRAPIPAANEHTETADSTTRTLTPEEVRALPGATRPIYDNRQCYEQTVERLSREKAEIEALTDPEMRAIYKRMVSRIKECIHYTGREDLPNL